MGQTLIGIYRIRLTDGLYTVEDRRTAKPATLEDGRPAKFEVASDAIEWATRNSKSTLNWRKRQ